MSGQMVWGSTGNPTAPLVAASSPIQPLDIGALTAACAASFRQEDIRGVGLLSRSQSRIALSRVFLQYRVSPLPNEAWHDAVFVNFDRDQDGHLGPNEILEIAQQFLTFRNVQNPNPRDSKGQQPRGLMPTNNDPQRMGFGGYPSGGAAEDLRRTNSAEMPVLQFGEYPPAGKGSSVANTLQGPVASGTGKGVAVGRQNSIDRPMIAVTEQGTSSSSTASVAARLSEPGGGTDAQVSQRRTSSSSELPCVGTAAAETIDAKTKIRELCSQAFLFIDPNCQTLIGLAQARTGLAFVLQNLGGAVPLPNDNWYLCVFQNFDTDGDGLISFEDFVEIVQQFYKHHTKKAQRQAAQQRGSGGGQIHQTVSSPSANSKSPNPNPGAAPVFGNPGFQEGFGFSPASPADVRWPAGEPRFSGDPNPPVEADKRLTFLEVQAAKEQRQWINDGRAELTTAKEEATFPRLTYAEIHGGFSPTASPEGQQIPGGATNAAVGIFGQDNHPGASPAPWPPGNDVLGGVLQPGVNTGQVHYQKNLELSSQLLCPTHTGCLEIFDDYKFFDNATLGKGAFGKVMTVQHKKTGTLRACKCMQIAGPQVLELAQQEVALMRTLEHPNIMRLYETFYDGDRCVYLIVELCEGGQLYDRILYHYEQLRQPMPEARVASYVEQMLSAMSYCHQRQVVHRDMKPENVLFVNTGADSPLKIIDFGLSNTVNGLQASRTIQKVKRKGPVGTLANLLPTVNGKALLKKYDKKSVMQKAGTAHFMAPEVHEGEYGPKADVFSVGCMLYQLLSGQHPFFIAGVDDENSVRERIMTCDAEFPESVWCFISPMARDICRKLLSRRPERRASAVEALAHPWFRSAPKLLQGSGTAPSASIFDGLRSYTQHNRLKQAGLRLLARELSEGQIQELRDIFMQMDLDKDGMLTAEELLRGMRRCGYDSVLTLGELHRIVEATRTTSPGIGYQDFLSALLPRRVVLEEAQIREAFDKLDVLREGKLTRQGLAGALKVGDGEKYTPLPQKEVEAIFQELGVDEIDYIAFRKCVIGSEVSSDGERSGGQPR